MDVDELKSDYGLIGWAFLNCLAFMFITFHVLDFYTVNVYTYIFK